MSKSRLPERLFQLDGFQELFQPIVIQSISRQFDNLIPNSSLNRKDVTDWGYLLLCASILAQSENSQCQDAAFRIAQFCLIDEGPSEEQKLSATVVLDKLTNSPAIKLAVERGYIGKDYDQNYSLPIALERINRQIKYSIIDESTQEIIPINRFQELVYQGSRQFDWLSVSAPTSSGKSFILLSILSEILKEEMKKNIVYLVPTRSLIQQVEQDVTDKLVQQNITSVFVTSVPVLPEAQDEVSLVYILTQERFQWLLNDEQNFIPDLVIVDEAQKIGDGARGVLLQEVIEEATRRSSKTKFIFSSPMTENPEILLEQAPEKVKKKTVVSEHVAVNQNLIWVSQIPRKTKHWSMDLCLGEQMINLGYFHLPHRPSPDSKRLSFVSFVLSDPSGGNLIYVNEPAEAEKMAHQLWELQGEESEKANSEINELAKLIKTVIHPKYSLANMIKRGVGYHYGNMPLLIKNEIERLFKKGTIKFLICTSTLIEGVNLPAKSIFIRGPRRGKGKPMNEIDFWNLAGRAGRQGKEFQGNVICIDPTRSDAWHEPPPRNKRKFPIKPTIHDIIFENHDEFLEYVNESAATREVSHNQEFNHAFVYFVCEYLRNGNLQNAKSLMESPETLVEELETTIEEVLSYIEIPEDIIYRNSGVSPIALQNLLDYFKEYDGEPEDLIPAMPESDNALNNYMSVIEIISIHLSGDSLALTYPYAKLVCYWMRGYSLSYIINKNWDYWRDHGKKLPSVIRDTMRQIEEYARFKFVKYTSCYIDVLKYYIHSIERTDLLEHIPEMNIWLEFGASQKTQVSLMSLGLSRTSAIAVSELIVSDGLTVQECLEWLSFLDLTATDLSSIIVNEIEQVLIKHNFLLNIK